MIPMMPVEAEFGPLRPRTCTRRIIIHHSASPDVPAGVIHSWHRQRGWSGLGYHAIIRRDGTIEGGRPLETVGAHAGAAHNHDSIGICLTGDFMQYQPSPPQLDSLQRLVDYLEHRYETKLEVLRHKDVAATDCPGCLFPWPASSWTLTIPGSDLAGSGSVPPAWQESLVEKARTLNLITGNHRPEDLAPKWFVLAVGLNIIKEVSRNAGKDY